MHKITKIAKNNDIHNIVGVTHSTLFNDQTCIIYDKATNDKKSQIKMHLKIND